MKITVKCAICGNEFESSRLNAKYCSPECRARAYSDMALECYRRKKAGVQPKKHDYAPKKCAVCGKEFKPHSSSQLTCSSECSRERRNEFMRVYNAKYKKEKVKENATQSEVKPKRSRIVELTTANSCPKDCKYQGWVGSIPCCDYILITGEPRGCEVGKGCIRYKREQGKRKKSQDMPKITHRPDDDAEFCGFKQENMNRIVGNNHRKGTR